MRKLISVGTVVVVLAVVFFMLGPLYVIDEGEQAVITRFGEIVSSETTAGLKFKMPVIDTVVRYPRRLLSWDGDPRRIPTSEGQFIWIDTTARWKVSDPARFYESVTTLQSGYARLDDVIESAVRTIIADNPLVEAVRDSNIINELERDVVAVGGEADTEDLGEFEDFEELEMGTDFPDIQKGRRALSNEMFRSAAATTEDFGVELIDIIVRQIRYSDDLTESVYDRMVSERNREAQFFRSTGEGRKEEILGQLDQERRTILSGAYEEAERIRGAADAQAAAIYSAAYQGDPDFFQFWRSIESYRETLPNFRKTLSTDSDYFRFLHRELGQ
ncbi:MAG: protease modulator HflC [Spirochaetaceae bacterium]|nr:MAG: protease modulator HflC [Spirochaetaceae bacterium]